MKKLALAFLACLVVACSKDTLRTVDVLQRQSTPPSSRIVEADTVHIGWFDKRASSTGWVIPSIE
jgi:hypothetical protein